MSSGVSPAGPARLAVFLSGSGRSLVNLQERIAANRLRAEIALVVASKECLGAERARGLGIPTRVMSGNLPIDTVELVLNDAGINWVVLAGYIRLFPIPRAYSGRVVNIHPALLPSFGGHGMYGHHVHEAVIAAGCRVSGCTVHLCDEQYDRGPILVQRTCPVRDDDTPDSLAARVFEQECEAYPEALELLIAGRVKIEGRRARILDR